MDASKKYAQVIVDVPSLQVNHHFDYAVPKEWQDIITVGMRVQVPFGVRQVLAYVVGFSDQTDFAGEVKPLAKLMDEAPVLTPELIALGNDMSRRLFTFQVLCYQAMLPSLLKVDYAKYFLPTASLTFENRQNYFADEHEIAWQEAEKQGSLSDLIALQKDDQVWVDYRMADRKQRKTEKWLQPLLDYDVLAQISRDMTRHAPKQQDLLAVLMDLDGQAIACSYLRQEFDLKMPTIRAGEKKGWLTVFEQEIDRNPYADLETEKSQAKSLYPQQEAAYQAVAQAMDAQQAQTLLLQGVTGSGKTEVYLQLIQHALDQGKTAILLVPEIALTPQMVTQLKGRFADQVAVLHSQLSRGEHFDEWTKLKKGQAKIAVGARSSIFAPLDKLGVIILDEEHETTYKQNTNPRYHARQVAKWRGAYHNCPVVLGSATPSLESRARAQNGLYQRLLMPERTNQQSLPQIDIVDMREEFQHKNYYQFSRQLRDAINATLDRGEQVALMLNRRGFANYMQCQDCGHVFQCPNCDVSLTHHYDSQSLQCHYCSYSQSLPQSCPKCRGKHLRSFGSGTEKVEQEIYDLFPGRTLVRMDNDTTRRKGSHQKILDQVANQEADILLGTQMIAKGLDFPNITLVGVINADTSLYLPDFRASERTFQLLTQVAGRAGRGDLTGQVIIQTFNPDHYALQFAQNHDYEGFYRWEMTYRKVNHYSPYYYSVRITVANFDEKTALRVANEIRQQLDQAQVPGTRIIGPSQSALTRLKNNYYFQILYQYRDWQSIQPVFDQIKDRAQEWDRDHIHVGIDLDPMTFI
ncbi:primosomal protein N' [Aerococcus kribbianus]|uniref:Replication restart protein PriA n=1 Tax=Aerococcus kribbianus TaxID=2999064 RepID=A0A9X3JD75_9LACT|nr:MULTISPECIES: primosomal protein N' [unclassified Aerococcus]MCZ0717200.1 primosomal protein N' [Aerococcus sp. YH-aer221]MCZ0725488.1 primosomal protein N' [Aerococcus sp. YH-aer222]